MKNNKGFTLIELISIMIILGVLALVAVPIINKYVIQSREVAYEEQIERIIEIAQDYVIESEEFLYTEAVKFTVTLDELKESGYLKNEDLINPKTNKKMKGCIKVTYNDLKDIYEYEYTETCSN